MEINDIIAKADLIDGALTVDDLLDMKPYELLYGALVSEKKAFTGCAVIAFHFHSLALAEEQVINEDTPVKGTLYGMVNTKMIKEFINEADAATESLAKFNLTNFNVHSEKASHQVGDNRLFTEEAKAVAYLESVIFNKGIQ